MGAKSEILLKAKSIIERVLLDVLGIFFFFFIAGCEDVSFKTAVPISDTPVIFPDYKEVVVPANIAPLNFQIEEEGEVFKVYFRVGGKSEEVPMVGEKTDITQKQWTKIMEQARGSNLMVEVYRQGKGKKWESFKAFPVFVAKEEIDPVLTFRLIYPGYELWNKMGIYQRELTSFNRKPILENKTTEKGCMNCHTFRNHTPDQMVLHLRGKHGGTLLVENEKVRFLNTKVKGFYSSGVYPAWHPSGKWITFSLNKIQQYLHAGGRKKIEVADLVSDLMLLNPHSNKVIMPNQIADSAYLETYPNWSVDGRLLYFCRAPQPQGEGNIRQVRYDLMRVTFDPETVSFGKPEVIFNASEKGLSATFPRISPDGRFLVFTVAHYGCFPIWHAEADLKMIDLHTGQEIPMMVNSSETESFHDWSSNSRWLVFSSKRLDGTCARPYFCYVGPEGKIGKPFVLPQKDPAFYKSFLKTYNLPQFIKSSVKVSPWDLGKMVHRRPEKVFLEKR